MRLLIIISVAIVFASCNKELPDEFVPYNASLQTDTAWKLNVAADAPVNGFKNLIPDSFIYKGFSNNNPIIFQVNDSIKVEVPANILLKDGNKPPVPEFYVNVTDYNRKGRVLANAISTMYTGQLLEYGNMIKVNFYGINGVDKLTVAPGKFYTVRAKSTNSNPLTGLNVFYYDSLTPALQSNWLPATDNSTVTTNLPGTSTDPGYVLQLANTGLISAARALDNQGAEKIRINVIMPVSFTNANTMVFALFKQHNTVVRLKPDFDSRSFYAENIPAGKEINIVSVSKVGTQFYFGNISATATKSAVIKLSPAKKSDLHELYDAVLGL